jgi:hypothetical protein
MKAYSQLIATDVDTGERYRAPASKYCRKVVEYAEFSAEKRLNVAGSPRGCFSTRV